MHGSVPSGNDEHGIMYCLFHNEDINVRRDCVLRCLSIYLNEDLDSLIKEYVVSILSF